MITRKVEGGREDCVQNCKTAKPLVECEKKEIGPNDHKILLSQMNKKEGR